MEASVRTHDTLNRRLRDRRSPRGTRITPQQRDLVWFEMLHRHGPLSSTYLHEFTAHLCKSAKRTRERLKNLYNESNTPHGGPYLERPWRQFETLDPRRNDLVYDLTERAEQALRDHGLFRAGTPRPSGAWKHSFMVSTITAALHLESLKSSSLRFIFQDEIVPAGKTLRTVVPLRDPRTGRTEERALMPDAIFGIEYTVKKEKLYLLFALEADRNHEPNRAATFNRKSYARTILQYREYLGRSLYKTHLGRKCGMLVLNVTTNLTHLHNILSLVNELTDNRGLSYLLFKTVPQFGGLFRPPKLLPELLHLPWQRPGYEPLCITRA